MTDNWEPSDAAVEAALDAYERTPGFADSVRAALIAAHAVAEKEGATLVGLERDKADTLLRDAIGRRKALENVAGVMAYALKHGRPWSEAIERQYHKAMGFDHALAPRTKP